MDTIPIKDSKDLVRDRKSNAIINTNRKEQKRIIAQREKKKQLEKDVGILKQDVHSIKDSLEKILSLLGK